MYSRSCGGGQPRLRSDQQISGDQVIMLERWKPYSSTVWGRTVRCERAVPALCEKSAVFHPW